MLDTDEIHKRFSAMDGCLYSVRAVGNAQNCCHFVLDLLKHGGEYAAIQLQGMTGSLFPSSSELTFYEPQRAVVSTAYTPYDVVHRLRGVQGGLKGLKQRELDFLDISDSTTLLLSLLEPEKWFHPTELMNARVAVCTPAWDSSAEVLLRSIFCDRTLSTPMSHAEWESMLSSSPDRRSVSCSGVSASRGRTSSTASDNSSLSGRSHSSSSLWSHGDLDSCGDESEQIVVRPTNRADFLIVYDAIVVRRVTVLASARLCVQESGQHDSIGRTPHRTSRFPEICEDFYADESRLHHSSQSTRGATRSLLGGAAQPTPVSRVDDALPKLDRLVCILPLSQETAASDSACRRGAGCTHVC